MGVSSGLELGVESLGEVLGVSALGEVLPESDGEVLGVSAEGLVLGVALAVPVPDDGELLGLELAVPVPPDGELLPESEGLLLTLEDGVSEAVPRLGELDPEVLGVSALGLVLAESVGLELGDSEAVPALGVRSAGAASQSLGGSVKSM